MITFRSRIQGMRSKFNRKWKGPYMVREVLSDTTRRICKPGDECGSSQVVRLNRLRPAHLSLPTSEEDRSQTVAEECEVPSEGGIAVALGQCNAEWEAVGPPEIHILGCSPRPIWVMNYFSYRQTSR